MARNFLMIGTVDLFRRNLKLDDFPWASNTATPLLTKRQVAGGFSLYFDFPPGIPRANLNGIANLYIEEERVRTLRRETPPLFTLGGREQIAAVGPDDNLMAVNGSPQDA